MKIIKPRSKIQGTFIVSPDKSITHRAIMLASIAKGRSRIKNFSQCMDCLSTIDCLRELGADIEIDNTDLYINGYGLSLKKPYGTLYAGNSGTTIRLISGILSGQNFDSTITGDKSTKKRPMDRIITPLTNMGAKIKSLNNSIFAPIYIRSSELKGICLDLCPASAQVKSAVLLAGLYAKGKTQIIEHQKTRNHTELMLKSFNGNIIVENNIITIEPGDLLATNIIVPYDISSAAFLIVACLILKDSSLTIKNVGVNETRLGIITALIKMGAHIKMINNKYYNYEPVCDISVKSSELRGIEISKDYIPSIIDELPILAVAASLANGRTVIKDASELKVKESNRIKTMVCELSKMGANIQELKDGMVINGVQSLRASELLTSYNDHRVAMSLTIAALTCAKPSRILNTSCVDTSFPDFFNLIT